jgi:hypothetical protein
MSGGALFLFALMATEGAKYGPAITESLFKIKY